MHKPSAENLKLLKKSIAILNDSNKKLDGKLIRFDIPKTVLENPENAQRTSPDDFLLREQLGFINKISADISKVTDNILQNS